MTAASAMLEFYSEDIHLSVISIKIYRLVEMPILLAIQSTSRRSSHRALKYVHCRRWWSNAGVWAAKGSRVSTKSPVSVFCERNRHSP